jgi:ATP-dependent Clp endopeptidase proteolytic subunit ClpP
MNKADYIELQKKLTEDKVFMKKYNKLKKSLEQHLGTDVEINLSFTPDEDEDMSEFMQNGMPNEMEMQNEFWNQYSVALKELLEHRIDVADKTIHLSSDISDLSLSEIDTKVRIIEKLSDTYKEDETENDKLLKIVITTYGGDAYTTLGIVDLINEKPYKVHGVGRGQIMSGGAFILIACDYREMSKNSWMMIHQTNGGFFGAFKDMAINYEHLKLVNNCILNLLVSRSNKDLAWWESKLKEGDFYLSADEAKDLGLIDNVIQYESK